MDSMRPPWNLGPRACHSRPAKGDERSSAWAGELRVVRVGRKKYEGQGRDSNRGIVPEEAPYRAPG